MRCRFLIILTCLFFKGYSQGDSVAFSMNFPLYEGLYLEYTDMRHNWPIAKEKIITKINKDQLDFYSKLMEGDKIEFIERDGSQTFIQPSKVWGYCQNNVIYINYQKNFCRIPVFGAISFFVGVVEVINYTPGYGGVFINSPTGAGNPTKVKELREFLFHFYSGELVPFSTDKVLEFLKPDPDIYNEYNKLSKKKKKELFSKYIRMYNEKHPVYFPKN